MRIRADLLVGFVDQLLELGLRQRGIGDAHLGRDAETACVSIFVLAVEVAAPAILAMLITDVAFGLVSKVVPQMNAFSIALPLKVGVAILVVGASLPFLGGWISFAVVVWGMGAIALAVYKHIRPQIAPALA